MKKFLIGCGIVVAVLVLLSIGATVVTVRYLKHSVPDTDALESFETQLQEDFGHPETFLPPIDGTVPSDRVALYVRLREGMLELNAPLLDRMAVLASESRERTRGRRGAWGKITGFLSNVGPGMAMLRGGTAFLTTADSLLIDAGMGKGEFDFYNTLALFCWSGWDPEEIVNREGPGGEGDPFDDSARGLRRIMRERFVRQLENAQAALDRMKELDDSQRSLSELLEQELRSSRRDVQHFPLQGALPPGWSEALDSHATALRATLPDDLGAVLMEFSLAVDINSEGQGFQIQFENDGDGQ